MSSVSITVKAERLISTFGIKQTLRLLDNTLWLDPCRVLERFMSIRPLLLMLNILEIF